MLDRYQRSVSNVLEVRWQAPRGIAQSE